MLIGTALLETLEILSKANLFKDDRSNICNAGLIVAHLLTFAHGMNPHCRLNENGWKSKVLQKADECNITIEGIPGIEKRVAKIRETGHSRLSDENQNVVDSLIECTLCYKGRSRSGGVVTLESLKAGIVRGWKQWAWSLEVRCQRRISCALSITDSGTVRSVLPVPIRQGRAGLRACLWRQNWGKFL